ncbi:hypothetical protein GCM10010277_14600 [Streptomyces longisporoflavus]|uniref:hypothetical protein n=1 Tax=Streptomyces longisporoflavus TaxID=28044 RepID=UPI00167EB728|nr:hypothetical protein [Streptomyces longisporoflavus]GGV31140.1 hypothetical protein GCM10010277_14600 [Streptomyces longisporoflavus]
MSDTMAPPSDYRILVPRDWFRVDLTLERWRSQLKTFVDREAADSGVSGETRRGVWTTLRNTAETGVAQGALEFFLKTEAPQDSACPASLLVSLLPTPPGLAPDVADLAETLTRRRGAGTQITTGEFPAGDVVRAVTETTLDFHVRMPGGVGYLVLAFSVPLSGTESSMGDLCDAIAYSLRWV